MTQATLSRIAILGFAREGQSLFAFLKKSPRYRNTEIWVLDRDARVKKLVSANDGARIHWQLGPGYLNNLSKFEVVFRSPGIPYTLPELVRARKNGVVVSSPTKLFFSEIASLSKSQRPRVIGITGTKGKGTTSTLIAKILSASGFTVGLGGNIGSPMLDLVPRLSKLDFVVLELSSFQLQDLSASPDVAVVLDIFPDHMDAHLSLREYYDAKANIGRFQKKTDTIFYFTTNPRTKKIALQSTAKKFPVTPSSDNLEKNYEMASAVARFLHCPERVISQTLKNFKGLPYRLEFVRNIRTKNGTEFSFWNDSAATNPEATAAALRTVTAPIVLIAGGKDKGLDYTPLAKAIKKTRGEIKIILFGENRKKIEQELKYLGKEIIMIDSSRFENVVERSIQVASKIAARHKTPVSVLFSPASASFDMFKSYADRGEQFEKIVRKYKP